MLRLRGWLLVTFHTVANARFFDTSFASIIPSCQNDSFAAVQRIAKRVTGQGVNQCHRKNAKSMVWRSGRIGVGRKVLYDRTKAAG